MPGEPCSTCNDEGMVHCVVHVTMNEACFACWNGEPCPSCQPEVALPTDERGEIPGGNAGPRPDEWGSSPLLPAVPDDQLARLRELLARCMNPRPWILDSDVGDVYDRDGDLVADGNHILTGTARLVIATVNALPALLDTIKAQQAENERLTEAMEGLYKDLVVADARRRDLIETVRAEAEHLHNLGKRGNARRLQQAADKAEGMG